MHNVTGVKTCFCPMITMGEIAEIIDGGTTCKLANYLSNKL